MVGDLIYEELREWSNRDLAEQVVALQDIINDLTGELSGEREISATLRQQLINIGGDNF